MTLTAKLYRLKEHQNTFYLFHIDAIKFHYYLFQMDWSFQQYTLTVLSVFLKYMLQTFIHFYFDNATPVIKKNEKINKDVRLSHSLCVCVYVDFLFDSNEHTYFHPCTT